MKKDLFPERKAHPLHIFTDLQYFKSVTLRASMRLRLITGCKIKSLCDVKVIGKLTNGNTDELLLSVKCKLLRLVI